MLDMRKQISLYRLYLYIPNNYHKKYRLFLYEILSAISSVRVS